MNNFLNSKIYGLTAESLSRGKTNLQVVSEMIAAGIKVIQYREKEKSFKAMYEECLAIRKLTKEAQVTFIINDRLDLALAVDADGLHIGQEDLPITIARKLLGKDKILGLSTHSPQEAHLAEDSKIVDYIGVGPIFDTATKKDAGKGLGLDFLNYVSKNIKIPFVAIGGIKEHNVQAVVKSGAKIVAIVSEIVGATDIKAKVQNIEAKMRGI